MRTTATIVGLALAIYCTAQVRVLFDASKAESAGNADWVIDADQHNIGYPSGPAVVGLGSESNAQLVPTPAQGGITSLTNETYWNAALSAWAIDCVKQGYQVESLPYNGQITFGDGTNAQDLANYAVFIVCEPNIRFNAMERSAIVNFVQSGGGLFIVSDHDQSDRNGDGWDSPAIWNDLFTNNGVLSDPFGLSFDLDDFDEVSSNVALLPGDSLIHGTMGDVNEVQWSGGTSITLHPADNPTVKGVVFRVGASTSGNTGVLCAYARAGAGRVVAIGDSSPCDDGTGDTNDQLYDGYYQDANGNHQVLLMNATIWLASGTGVSGVDDLITNDRSIVFPNPTTNTVHVRTRTGAVGAIGLVIRDIYGQAVLAPSLTTPQGEVDLAGLPDGMYLLWIADGSGHTERVMVQH